MVFFLQTLNIYCISHKNKLLLLQEALGRNILKKSRLLVLDILVLTIPGGWHWLRDGDVSGATVCVQAGEGTGLCRRSRPGAGTSYRDKTRWRLAGTEYLMVFVAHFWDSAGGRPEGVKLSVGASEGTSARSPQELLQWEEEEVPEWEEDSATLVCRAVPAAQRCGD